MNSTSTFTSLGVRKPLVDALVREGITAPFPIQADTLGDSLAGRDLLGRGKTGSGKTLAFVIPMVDRLADLRSGRPTPHRPTGLILAPTRELACQIAAAATPLASACGMTVTTIFGGVSQHRQEQAFARGVDIVVACPGRLEDLMRQRVIALDAIEVTVVDEADHMADLGFLPAVTRILTATPRDGQRLLFSATLDEDVNKLAGRFLPHAVRHSIDEATSPVATMTHHVFIAADADVKRALVHSFASGTGRRILFTRTKHHARKLAKQLTDSGIPAVDLHGNLGQGARARNLATFAAGEARVLVATDIAARGVHVDDVELVVHVDAPAEHKVYLHRSGRTARAGSTGNVVTLILPTERRDLIALMRKADIAVTPQQVTVDSPVVAQLIGDVAPRKHVREAPRGSAGAPPNSKRRKGSAPQGQSRGKRFGGAGTSTAHPGTRNNAAGQPVRRGATRGAGAAPAGSTGGLAAFSRGGRARGRRG